MAEYINKISLINSITEEMYQNAKGDDTEEYDFWSRMHSCIRKFPTVDVVERKHGKWENTLQGWKCSACHKEQDYSVFFDFCPNCGADMRKETG